MTTSSIFLYVGGMDGAGMILMLFFFLVPFLLMIWAIVDLTRRHFDDSANKIIWALAIIFIPVLGALVYLVSKPGQKSNSI